MSSMLRAFVLATAGLLVAGSVAAAVQLTSTSFKGVFVRTSEAAATLSESSQFFPVSDASIANFVVAGNADLFTVLFTGQVEMQNATSNISTLNEDALVLKIEAVKSGGGITTLSPTGPVGFASADSVASYAMSASARLGIGTYTIRVVGRVRDAAPQGTVSAHLDNWMLTVTRYD